MSFNVQEWSDWWHFQNIIHFRGCLSIIQTTCVKQWHLMSCVVSYTHSVYCQYVITYRPGTGVNHRQYCKCRCKHINKQQAMTFFCATLATNQTKQPASHSFTLAIANRPSCLSLLPRHQPNGQIYSWTTNYMARVVSARRREFPSEYHYSHSVSLADLITVI